jgi:glutamate formiminotransferase/glutamate formiminotransferase/formiminotetrahydrofolate cyclodeaminase
MPDKPLLAVPNVSEGRRQTTIDAIGRAFTAAGTARLLDVHSDADHHRSVFTLAGAQGSLSGALLAGARVAVERIDVGEDRNVGEIGVHPHVGALDVMPLVYLDADQRGAACAEALVVASGLGEGLGVPVFLYGELAQGRTRAELRRGGVTGLTQRLSKGELHPDFGPSRMHPTAGATLVAAREPLVAFNLELAPSAGIQEARRIASLIREGGAEGLPGLRAIGVPLRPAERDVWAGDSGADREEDGKSDEHGQHSKSSGHRESKSPMSPARGGDMPSGKVVPQLSMNVERPLELPLRVIVEAVRRHADIACAELVGLAPRAAFEDFPEDVPLPGFDPEAHVIENALGF